MAGMNRDGSCSCDYPLAPNVCQAFGLNQHVMDYEIWFEGFFWIELCYEPCPYCGGFIRAKGPSFWF